MTHFFRSTFLVFLVGLLIVSSGCAKKKTSRVGALEAQVNQITDELVRLDQSIQEIRASIATQQSTQGGFVSEAVSSARATGSTGVYRTPSGFELPSKSIQKALKNAGYYQGTVDGKIGSATKDAVKSFQRDHGLEADGVVGRRTWDKMKDYLGGATGAGAGK